ARLEKADRCGHNQLAATCLLVAGGKRALPQKIEFILVEAALEAKKEPIIAMARQVNCLLVDQHRVHHPAHLDQLLPIAAVAGEAGALSGGNRAYFAETNLRDHPLETGAHDAAGGRATEIVVNDFDLGPAE